MHLNPIVALRWIALTTVFTAVSLAMAGDITPKMQPNIDQYKKQAALWAANPLIVQAVKEANVKGPISGLGNT